MNSLEIVLSSAQATAAWVGTARFVKMSELTLSRLGVEIARLVRDDEKPGVLSPVDVEVGRRNRPGAILVLEDRAIVVCSLGTVRMRSFLEVIPIGVIQAVRTGTLPGRTFLKPRETLTIEAIARRHLIFMNMFDGGRTVVPLLKSRLTAEQSGGE